MIIIGLTGSIGMGKSETAKIFVAQGVPVFDADAVVRQAQSKNGESLPFINAAFPGVVVDGELDRVALGAQVFANKEALIKLEKIMHPIVQEARKRFFQTAEVSGVQCVALDVPLLFETGGDAGCDYTVVASAPKDVQRARVLARPDMTEAKFEDILTRQLSDEEKRQRADFVIETNKGFAAAACDVGTILKKLKDQ